MDKQELKVPKERIAVLIGKSGETKELLERKGSVHLNIDSKEGDVIIEGEDSIAVFEMKDVLKAIARGFSPEVAMNLLKEDYAFELIDITDFTGKSKKKTLRMKGRVIGSEGKSRNKIEEITGTNISVYGKTIGLIGKFDNVALARNAIEMLLDGSPHSNVYKWLEDKKRSLRRIEMQDEELD